MDELLKRFITEKLQLEEHIQHGELEEYGPENADDLLQLFTMMIKILAKGAEQDAA